MTPQDALLDCPECHTHVGVLVPGVSAESRMDYFRCEGCAQVWTAEKTDQTQATDDGARSA